MYKLYLLEIRMIIQYKKKQENYKKTICYEQTVDELYVFF